MTDSELLGLPLGSKIKVIWHNSTHHHKNDEYYGVIFGDKIGYDDGEFDDTRTIAECVFNDWCMVYILEEMAEELKKQNKYTDDKQTPKKPIFDFNYSDTLSKFHCICGSTIKVYHDIGTMNNNDAPNYCSNCGQKLDFGE